MTTPEPTNDRPWLNPGSDPVSERVYSLIFNGLTAALTDFMPLTERARVSEAIYESLRTGGIEVRFGDGLAKLREAAAEVQP
jgi:hypothetical protein